MWIAIATLTLLLFVGGVLALLRIQRMQRELHHLTEEVQAGRRELAALTKASVGVGTRLIRTEQKVRHVGERQDQWELRTDSGERSFSQAIQLVQRGADARELMSTCGLTLGEAELIVMLHGQGEGAASSNPLSH